MPDEQKPLHLFGVFDKWPDMLELWREDELSPPVLKFVLMRRNNRSLQSDQTAMLRTLEEAGNKVVIRVGTTDLTLTEFEKGGVYGALPTRSNMLAQSTLYNKRAELKRFRNILENMPEDDPRREQVVKRINDLTAMVEVNETPGYSPEKMEKSYDDLMKLRANILDPRNMSEEELAKNFPTRDSLIQAVRACGVEVSPDSKMWISLSDKWAKGFLKKNDPLFTPPNTGDNNNA